MLLCSAKLWALLMLLVSGYKLIFHYNLLDRSLACELPTHDFFLRFAVAIYEWISIFPLNVIECAIPKHFVIALTLDFFLSRVCLRPFSFINLFISAPYRLIIYSFKKKKPLNFRFDQWIKLRKEVEKLRAWKLMDLLPIMIVSCW